MADAVHGLISVTSMGLFIKGYKLKLITIIMLKK